MRLTVVGAGPAYSNDPRSLGACYLVRSGDRAIVLDLGHGSFAGLAARFPPERLEAVVISHLHPDHFVDLVPLRHYLRYHLVPARRLRVDAHPDLPARLDGLHAEPGFSAAALDVAVLEPGIRVLGPFELEVGRVTHTADSFAFRVSDGRGRPGLVYSGDLGVAGDLRVLVRPGDTLLVEVSFGAGPVPAGALHLDGPAVGALAAESGAGRVLLTHLLMGHDPDATVASVRARYAGPVELVTPGFETEI
ncbi:MAG TPA: MBL fold metallo-hydrolase [Candidatus Sulfomarinibacteraceae bacterium]|nr:MBL fold metallo-hydrolase [Candidatus Sulfomarinibacteraceae bacterium]